MKTEWNYSELAKPYLNRPDYSAIALTALFEKMKITDGKVCDIGAGVAHLTIPLLKQGFVVDAVEPNDEMRKLGSQRTKPFKNVNWFEGTGESTGRANSEYDIATFGSSFNVTDRPRSLIETCRILKPNGWFACMWNHRDLNDSIQKDVEGIIKKNIPNYDYGARREDQSQIINSSKLFGDVFFTEGSITHNVSSEDWVDAWKSHATLARQAGDNFYKIIEEIEGYLSQEGHKSIAIPYVTRIWFAQKK